MRRSIKVRIAYTFFHLCWRAAWALKLHAELCVQPSGWRRRRRMGGCPPSQPHRARTASSFMTDGKYHQFNQLKRISDPSARRALAPPDSQRRQPKQHVALSFRSACIVPALCYTHSSWKPPNAAGCPCSGPGLRAAAGGGSQWGHTSGDQRVPAASWNTWAPWGERQPPSVDQPRSRAGHFPNSQLCHHR